MKKTLILFLPLLLLPSCNSLGDTKFLQIGKNGLNNQAIELKADNKGRVFFSFDIACPNYSQFEFAVFKNDGFSILKADVESFRIFKDSALKDLYRDIAEYGSESSPNNDCAIWDTRQIGFDVGKYYACLDLVNEYRNYNLYLVYKLGISHEYDNIGQCNCGYNACIRIDDPNNPNGEYSFGLELKSNIPQFFILKDPNLVNKPLLLTGNKLPCDLAVTIYQDNETILKNTYIKAGQTLNSLNFQARYGREADAIYIVIVNVSDYDGNYFELTLKKQ